MTKPASTLCTATIVFLATMPAVRANFDLSFAVTSPDSFTASQLQILQDAILDAEAMWEGVITGYQPGITIGGISVSVIADFTVFANATPDPNVYQGGFWLNTGGEIRINPDLVIDWLGSWDGSGGPYPDPTNIDEFLGVNYIDEIIAHEVGHLLGIGTQWTNNGVYTYGSEQYTGQYGVAAYRDEFDAAATFVPVETAGASGTQYKHWDQFMRSSSQEGNPSDPFSLDPRVDITDQFGRDLAMELMTGAIDPDYGEPFLSNTTVQSLRDLGFTVVPEPSSVALLAIVAAIWLFQGSNFAGRV